MVYIILVLKALNRETVRYPPLDVFPPPASLDISTHTAQAIQTEHRDRETDAARDVSQVFLQTTPGIRRAGVLPNCPQLLHRLLQRCSAVLLARGICRCSCYTNPVENMSAEDSAIGALGFARTTGLYCTVITSSREPLETSDLRRMRAHSGSVTSLEPTPAPFFFVRSPIDVTSHTREDISARQTQGLARI